MDMDKQLLDKLMRMAKLELSEAEQVIMLTDLNKICSWIEKLQEVDTEGLDPLTAIVSEQPTLREDAAQPPLDHTKALSSSKNVDSNYFRVPKVKYVQNISS
jgi:aspartyl-tRNA(Asn)/glutamyl-tRNA(Gln) amidotransferase subunit C